MKLTSKIFIGAGLLVLLSACDGHGSSSSSSSGSSTTPPTVTATPQSQISTQFATDFGRSPLSDPVKPSQSDLPAVSLTATPIALH